MISIDTVYQKVLALANKEQRGYITPQEFNLFADQAQKEIFEQYFYDSSQLTRSQSNSKEYGDIVDNLNEKIAIFEVLGTVVGGTINAPGIYRLGTVDASGVEIEEVQRNEFMQRNNSPLTSPSLSRPVYVRTGETTIDVFPLIATPITCSYIRTPTMPSWGYFVVGNKALHDTSNLKTTNFELHPSEEAELVYKILKYSGITIQKGDLTQGGQGLESLQVQQEKQ